MCKRVMFIYVYMHVYIYIYLFVCLFTFYDYYSHRKTITQRSYPFCDSRTTFSPPHPSLLALFPLISLLKAENLKTNALLQHVFLHNSLHYSKCLFYVCGLHTNTQRETLSLFLILFCCHFCHAINLHPSVSFLAVSPSTHSGSLLLSALIKVHSVTERH